MSKQHTAAPWRNQGQCVYAATVEGPIAEFYSFGKGHVSAAEADRNAEFAARAASAYDALVSVLKELLGDKPDRYGYYAAQHALDDGWRARAHAALQIAERGLAAE